MDAVGEAEGGGVRLGIGGGEEQEDTDGRRGAAAAEWDVWSLAGGQDT